MLRQNKEIIQALLDFLSKNPICSSNREAILQKLECVLASLDNEKLGDIRNEIRQLEDWIIADAATRADFILFDCMHKHGFRLRQGQPVIIQRIKALAVEIEKSDEKTDRDRIAKKMQDLFICINKSGMENIELKIFEIKKTFSDLRKVKIEDINIDEEITKLAINGNQSAIQSSEMLLAKKLQKLQLIQTFQAIQLLQKVIWEEYQRYRNPVLLNMLVSHNMSPPMLQVLTVKQCHELSKEMELILLAKSPLSRKMFSEKLDAVLSGPMHKKSSLSVDRLRQSAYDDFIKAHDTTIIDVLIKHKMSPLAALKVRRVLQEDSKQEEDSGQEVAAMTLQSYVHSYNRHHLHMGIFKKPPNKSNFLLDQINNLRVKKIIYELAGQAAVVDRHVYHWTVIPNFVSILRNNAFYGAEQLSKQGLSYQKNALSEFDVENGDGNVICFCPYFVDFTALIKPDGEVQLREKLIRLTIDLDKINIQGSNNQFFKLFDFAAPPFDKTVIISSEFQVQFIKKADNECSVFFRLFDKEYVAKIEFEDVVFYGNLYAINQFCLLKLLELVERAKPIDATNLVAMQDEFNSYLNKLNEADIKKIFILFAQGLTIYAEYNFNGSLKLTDHLITEIYFVDSSTKVSLKGLLPDQYSETLKHFSSQLFAEPIQPLLTFSENDPDAITFYGSDISINLHISTMLDDFADVPAEMFDQAGYVETRGRVESLLARPACGLAL